MASLIPGGQLIGGIAGVAGGLLDTANAANAQSKALKQAAQYNGLTAAQLEQLRQEIEAQQRENNRLQGATESTLAERLRLGRAGMNRAENYNPAIEDQAAIDAAEKSAGRALGNSLTRARQGFAGNPENDTRFQFLAQRTADDVLNPLQQWIADRRSTQWERKNTALRQAVADADLGDVGRTYESLMDRDLMARRLQLAGAGGAAAADATAMAPDLTGTIQNTGNAIDSLANQLNKKKKPAASASPLPYTPLTLGKTAKRASTPTSVPYSYSYKPLALRGSG